MPRILLADPHPIFREGFRSALGGQAGFEIGCVANARSALAALRADRRWSILLLGVPLPDARWEQILATVRRHWPKISVGILTAAESRAIGTSVRDAGGSACLSKTRDVPQMVEAMNSLARGQAVFDGGRSPIDGITGRRRRIMAMAAEGMTNKQIGRALGIAERTVKDHWSRIFDLLGAPNRTAAIATAQRGGLI